MSSTSSRAGSTKGNGGDNRNGMERMASDGSDADKIELRPDEKMMLVAWYLTVRDSMSQTPILKDRNACDLIDKIKLDLSRKEFRLDPSYVQYAAGRSKQLDEWTQDFLDRHQYEDVLVLELACGLNRRWLRVKHGKDVKWVDVDNARITDMRTRLFPRPEGDYELISAQVGGEDDAWLRRLPSDRPTLIIMESLTYYLEPSQGLRLFSRLLDHFPNGNIACDTIGSVGVSFARLMPLFRDCEARRFKWGIDDAKELNKLDARLVLRENVYAHEFLDAGLFAKNYPPMFGSWTPLISLLPAFKKNGQFLHFEF